LASGYDIPDNAPVVDEGKRVTLPWASFFGRLRLVCQAAQQSGTTANRPTSKLWIGRGYFDTTLGKPVWVKQVSPTVVWVDATGTTV
jgi:hypothetical protein